MSEINSILASTTLDQLKSEEQTQLRNVIDELRSHNIGQLLGEDGLPQLIVCGDESSGKSSLLESLTRVRFPVRSNTCTTFATELRLRREPSLRINSRISPGHARSPT
jgi:GTP1/Obg family GTP-binding protein